MAYENTEVPVSRSQEAIRKLLLANGATGIAFVHQADPLTEGFEAMVPISGSTYRIRIMAKIEKREGEARWVRGQYRTATDLEEQGIRRVWRVLYYHLKSVYEAVNSGVMEFRELMLPYVVTKDGKTVAQHI